MFKFLLPKGFCLNCSRDKKGMCKVKVIFTCKNRRIVRSDKGKVRIKVKEDNEEELGNNGEPIPNINPEPDEESR